MYECSEYVVFRHMHVTLHFLKDVYIFGTFAPSDFHIFLRRFFVEQC